MLPEGAESVRPHVVYDLGDPIPMGDPLPAGVNYQAGRMWVLVDLLLTSKTLSEALAASKALLVNG